MIFLDYYDVLGISRFTHSQIEIEQAYIRKISSLKRYAKNASQKDLYDMIQHYHTAYAVLSDEQEKVRYDDVLFQYQGVPDKNQIPKRQKERKPFWIKYPYVSIAALAATVLLVSVVLNGGPMLTQQPAQQTTVAAAQEPPRQESPNIPKDKVQATVEVRPWNGRVFYNTTGENLTSEICIETIGDNDYLVKLSRRWNQSASVLFYVRGGNSVTVPIAPGTYTLKYACGDGAAWYGTEDYFGEAGTYTMANDTLDFTDKRGWTIELYPHIDGNLEDHDIDKSNF